MNASWLMLNLDKTEEMIVGYRKQPEETTEVIYSLYQKDQYPLLITSVHNLGVIPHLSSLDLARTPSSFAFWEGKVECNALKFVREAQG